METRTVTVGDTLRRARLERNIKLPEVEVALRVRLRYLQALESDDWGALPPSVYTRMLIREYARFLGLDPALVLEMALPMRPEDRNPIRPAVQPLEQPFLISWKAILTVGVLALCAGLFLYLYAQYNSFVSSVDENRGGTVERVPTAVARGLSSAVTPIQPFPTETPPPTSTLPPSPTAITGLVVEARLVDRSWVQVWADGRPVVADTMPAGTTRAFSADQSIRMRVGNAGAVDITVNGVPQGRLGSPGQALEANWGRE